MEKAFAYICAPEDAGARLLARYCRKVFELGYVPICPKQVTNSYLSLQNPDECKEYHATARQLLRRCRMVVVCGNETTAAFRRTPPFRHGETAECLAQSTGLCILLRKNGNNTLPRSEDREIAVFTTEQQHAVLQASYRHRYGVFIRLTLCTGLRLGELLALKWEDIDMLSGTLRVRRTLNRLSTCGIGEKKTEIVFDTPKTKNSRRIIPLPKGALQDLERWKGVQQEDRQQAGESYCDDNFIVTNEVGKFFEQKTFKNYYNRILKDAGMGCFTFHALRHTFATRALEKGMDYKTLSAILGHFSVAFTMDTYVHCMDERKRSEMDKMNDLYDIPFDLPLGDLTYMALCKPQESGCHVYVPDFPQMKIFEPTMDKALLKAKSNIQKALRQYKNPPIPTKQENVIVPENMFLMVMKIA